MGDYAPIWMELRRHDYLELVDANLSGALPPPRLAEKGSRGPKTLAPGPGSNRKDTQADSKEYAGRNPSSVDCKAARTAHSNHHRENLSRMKQFLKNQPGPSTVTSSNYRRPIFSEQAMLSHLGIH